MRKSAVSLACEMLFFAVDGVYGVVMAMTMHYGSDTTYTLVILTWQLTFPIRTTVEAMSTEMTRGIFFETVNKIRHTAIG